MKLRLIVTRADVVLIVLFLAVASALFAVYNRSEGSIVEIRYGDRLIGQYRLEQNQVIEIDEGIAAEIREGKIRMLRSTCPHQVCVQQGWTSSPATPIVCVPRRVFIRIVSEKQKMMITE